MRFMDRLRLAFGNEQFIWTAMSNYASLWLSGQDSGTTMSRVDAETALTLSAVFACNRVLAETLASCPVFLYEKRGASDREPVTNAAQYDLLHYAPNPDMTPGAFKEFGVSNQNLGGNMYAQKVKNSRGELLQLRPIQWHRVRIEVDRDTGALNYKIDGTKMMTRDDILHIPGLTFDGYHGITPLEYAQTALKIGLSENTFQQKFYENGVMTSGVFEHPGEMRDDAFQRLKKDIATNYTGLKNTGVPMILEGGMKYREVTMKLTDAQFVESKRFSVEEVARIYRVPLHLIGDLTRSTNNNIEHQSLEFIIYTLLPIVKRWEENLNLQLLSGAERRGGWYFEFKLDALLRGDRTTRANAYASGRQWGYLSVNDIRRLENMPPIPNGDVYLQPANMIEAGSQPADAYNRLLDEAGQIIGKGGA